jgi:hypothetical protein
MIGALLTLAGITAVKNPKAAIGLATSAFRGGRTAVGMSSKGLKDFHKPTHTGVKMAIGAAGAYGGAKVGGSIGDFYGEAHLAYEGENPHSLATAASMGRIGRGVGALVGGGLAIGGTKLAARPMKSLEEVAAAKAAKAAKADKAAKAAKADKESARVAQENSPESVAPYKPDSFFRLERRGINKDPKGAHDRAFNSRMKRGHALSEEADSIVISNRSVGRKKARGAKAKRREKAREKRQRDKQRDKDNLNSLSEKSFDSALKAPSSKEIIAKARNRTKIQKRKAKEAAKEARLSQRAFKKGRKLVEKRRASQPYAPTVEDITALSPLKPGNWGNLAKENAKEKARKSALKRKNSLFRKALAMESTELAPFLTTDLRFGVAGMGLGAVTAAAANAVNPIYGVAQEGIINGIQSAPRGGISPELQMSTQGLTLGIHSRRKQRII